MVAGETATVATLKEDNRLLALKLKYLQSVTTIYRQKITAVTRQTLRHLADQIDVDARVSSAIDAAEMDTEAALKQFDVAVSGTSPNRHIHHSNNFGNSDETRALLYGSPPSSPRGAAAAIASSLKTPEDEAAFWRGQFLNVVAEMRPVSIHDAQVLCNALADKRQLQDEINALKHHTGGAQITSSAAPPTDGDAPTRASSLNNQATINMVLVSPMGNNNNGGSPHQHGGGERYADGVTLRDTTAASYPDTSPATFSALQTRLKEEQDKNKALRVRIGALSCQLGDNEADLRTHISTLRTENVKVLRGMRELETDRKRLVDDNHELNQQVLLHERTIALKESQIFRLEGRTKALERELQSASNRMDSLFEQEHERRAAETAALQKAFDDNRQLQNEIQLLRANLLSAQRQQEDSDIEYQKLGTAVTTLKNIQSQLRQAIEVAHLDKHAASLEQDSLKSLLPRMGTAQDELEKFFTFREVSSRCGYLNKQMDDLESVCKSMLELNKIIEMRHKEIRLLRGECERSTSIGVPPSVAQNVDGQLVDPDYTPTPELKPRKHVVLRQEGTWLEIRDTGSGRTTYITSAITESPFCPIKIKSAEEARKKREEEEAKILAADPALAAQVALREGKTPPVVSPTVPTPPPSTTASKTPLAPTTPTTSFPAPAVDADLPTSPTTPSTPTDGGVVKKEQVPSPPSAAVVPPPPITEDKVATPPSSPPHDGVDTQPVNTSSPKDALPPSPQPPQPSKKKRDPDAPIDPAIRDRLIRMFAHYNPTKLPTVDIVMDRFRGRYDAMMARLVQKYGPEPDQSTPLPELPPQVSETPAGEGFGSDAGSSSVASPHIVPSSPVNHTSDAPPPPPVVLVDEQPPSSPTPAPVVVPVEPKASPPPSSPTGKVAIGGGGKKVPIGGKLPIGGGFDKITPPEGDGAESPRPSLFGPSSPPSNVQRKIPVVKRPVVVPSAFGGPDSRDNSPSMSPPRVAPPKKMMSKVPIGGGGSVVNPDDI